MYSPSIQLPVSPLKQNCGQFMLGGEMLPETRPAATTDKAAVGANGLIRYAFSDRLTLQAKTWYALDNVNAGRSGISFSAIVPIGDTSSERIRYGGMLTAGFAASKEGIGGSNFAIDGSGFGLSALAWIPLEPRKITLYAALGPVFGVRNTSYNGYGYGALINVGLSQRIVSSLTANLEGTAILARDVYDARTDWILSPSLELGWEF